MRVLILAPWPLRAPRHGGQLRGAAVVRAYREAGHDVHTISFYDPNHTKPGDVGPEDLSPAPGVVRIMQSYDPSRSDMASWYAMADAQDNFDQILAGINRVKPDLLQFEEPVFWPIVRRLMIEMHLVGVAVAHSSYNFETLAWRTRGLLGSPISEETVRDLTMFEREIAARCDVIFAVSEEDADQFRKLGAKFVRVAANGVTSLDRRAYKLFGDYIPPQIPYALFVSSAHPPNARGFIDLAQGAEGHPLCNGELLICGRVGQMLLEAKDFPSTNRISYRSRVLGWVEDNILSALYAGSSVAILPKTHGGGSNLKTAEALISGRPIVATHNAFIGFENFLNFPGVNITSDPESFWSFVNKYLSSPIERSLRSLESMEGLLWSECLKAMVSAGEDAVQRVQKKE